MKGNSENAERRKKGIERSLHDVPGFDRVGGVDDLVPQDEYGDVQTDRLDDREESQTATLLNWTNEAPADALTARQLIELKNGVREAIEQGEHAISTPGSLNAEHWHHSGVGVSIWMHRSGVIVMSSGKHHIVTDADTLDSIDIAKAAFSMNPGPAVVSIGEETER